MRENKREKLEAKNEWIWFVSKHNTKTENSCLPNPRYLSSVNKPTSVGIDPVSIFNPINVVERIQERTS